MKINVGCDLVSLPRFKKSLENKKFVERVFNKVEQNYCNAKKDALGSYAARFAAKEAFAKAMGTGLWAKGIGFSDMWIENDIDGKPIMMVSDKLQKKFKKAKIKGWDVSLSHHGDYAMANVVIYGG